MCRNLTLWPSMSTSQSLPSMRAARPASASEPPTQLLPFLPTRHASRPEVSVTARPFCLLEGRPQSSACSLLHPAIQTGLTGPAYSLHSCRTDGGDEGSRGSP